MATIPRKPEGNFSQDSAPKLALSKFEMSPGPEARPGGSDALQALLAFSSLHEQIRARRSAGHTASSSPDQFVLYEVLQLVAERALALTEADGVAIALVQKGAIICRARTGTIAPEIGARLDPQCGLSGLCFLSGETVSCDDAEKDTRVNVAASRNLHARSIIAVPLRGRRTVIGLLEAFSKNPFAFGESDVRSLNLLAELVLGAMRPEEEETLEAFSPAPIKSEENIPAKAGAEDAPVLAFSHDSDEGFLELELPEENSAPAAEIPATLLRDYEKISTSRPNWKVVCAAVAVVLVSVSLLLWKFRSVPEGVAAAAKLPRPAEPAPPVSHPAVAPVAIAAELPEPTPISPEDARRSVLPLVTGVRHWESGDSTTVAIDLQDQVQYEVHRLNSPERIYFDLHDAVLAPGLNGTSIEIGNDLLARIRVAEPVAGVARIVLDTRNVSNFSVGLEPNPYRLIIEIRHSASEKPNNDSNVLRPSAPAADKLTASMQPISKEDQQLRAKVPHLRIVVDPGHGGWDLGTVGQQGVVEKDLVLDIAQQLGRLLASRLGSEILYTRTDDAYVPLEERAEIANGAQADLFVSVHANNSDYPSARGVETYYTGVSAPANSLEIEKRENATAMTVVTTTALSSDALKERTEQSRHLAASVERALYGILSLKNPGVRDRGVKEAGFVVLTGTTMPAVLAEISFVSSPADERNLQSSAYRQQIAEALYKGIARYAAASSRTKLASVR